jgi:hypothetical protein
MLPAVAHALDSARAEGIVTERTSDDRVSSAGAVCGASAGGIEGGSAGDDADGIAAATSAADC